MNIVQLAMQGRGHKKADLPCQDKTAALEENGTVCIALADGAGSARLSHYGAECSVQTITNLLCTEFDTLYHSENAAATSSIIITKLGEALEQTRVLHDCELKDLASTLLFSAQKDDQYIVGQLGDGCIAFLRDNECRLVGKPEKGEFANSTYFTTSAHPANHLNLYKGKIGSIAGFMLMSDGAAESLYLRNEDIVAPLVQRLINETFCKNNKWITKYLSDLFRDVILQRTTDDCSLITMSTFKNYREFFELLDPSSHFKLFYKNKRYHGNYTDDYVNILLHSSLTSDINILSQFTGLNIKTLKNRLRKLRDRGFRNISRFLN